MVSPGVSADPVQQRINTGANWFYWIAGVTLVNSVTTYSGSPFRFVMGLGATQLLDGFTSGSHLSSVAVGIDALVILTCAIVGRYARTGRPVYIVGMIVYGLDTLIFVVLRDIAGLAFHGFVLWNLLRGVRAFGELPNRARPNPRARTVAIAGAGRAS
jgi:hypothetical protein